MCIYFLNIIDVEFKKQVLRQLQIINLKQTQMCEDMQTIMTKIVMQNDDILTQNNDKEESIFNKFDFPLKSISELDALEDFISDENNCNLLVSIEINTVLWNYIVLFYFRYFIQHIFHINNFCFLNAKLGL